MRTPLAPEISSICAKFEVNRNHVREVKITTEWIELLVMHGKNGFCENGRLITSGKCLCPSGGSTHKITKMRYRITR